MTTSEGHVFFLFFCLSATVSLGCVRHGRLFVDDQACVMGVCVWAGEQGPGRVALDGRSAAWVDEAQVVPLSAAANPSRIRRTCGIVSSHVNVWMGELPARNGVKRRLGRVQYMERSKNSEDWLSIIAL